MIGIHIRKPGNSKRAMTIHRRSYLIYPPTPSMGVQIHCITFTSIETLPKGHHCEYKLSIWRLIKASINRSMMMYIYLSPCVNPINMINDSKRIVCFLQLSLLSLIRWVCRCTNTDMTKEVRLISKPQSIQVPNTSQHIKKSVTKQKTMTG